MNYHPILFSAEMVRAILEGRKRQTRRVVNTPKKYRDFWLNGEGVWKGAKTGELHEVAYDAYCENGIACFLVAGDQGWDGPFRCPYGQPGDRLWVRETVTLYANVTRYDVFYAAGGGGSISYDVHPFEEKYGLKLPRQPVIPSIFMPRWASRITLEVTGVRVERVQALSEADAVAEGVTDQMAYDAVMVAKNRQWPDARCAAFADLWDSINAARGYSWDSNPWVWVVEFKRVEGE